MKVTASRVDGCPAAPSNAYSELSRAKQRSHACRAASIGTFGSQASQSHAYSNGSDAPDFLFMANKRSPKKNGDTSFEAGEGGQKVCA